MPIHRKPVFFLLLLLFASAFVLPAKVLPVRLEVSLASNSSGDSQVDASVAKAVEAGLYDVLDWRFILTNDADTVFQAVIEDLKSDTSLFPNQRYLSFALRMKWNGMEAEQHFAVLGVGLKELEMDIAQAVRDQLRYDLLPFIPSPLPGWTLQYVKASVLSLLAEPTGFQLGDRYILTDHHGNGLGLVSVADIVPLQAGEAEHAIEFNLVQADRRPEPGMLVILKKTQWGYNLSPVVSLQDFGLEFEANRPLSSANSFLSIKSGMWLPYTVFNTPEAMELTFRVGLGSRLGLASLIGRTDHWLSDMEIGLTARLGVGAQLKTSGPALFLYGAEAELAVRHYSSLKWSWGLAVGYRFWNALDSGSLTILQGTDRLFATPFVGFAW